MNHLKEIALSRLTTGEVRQTASRMISVVDPLMSDAYVARQTQAVQDALDMLIRIDNTPAGSDLTDAIHRADDEVDRLLPLIESHLENSAGMGEFMPQQGDAAQVLLQLFEKRDRRKMIYGSYNDQSNEVESLFAELFADEYAQERTDSGIEALLTRLKASYEERNRLLEARLREDDIPTTTREQKQIIRYRLDALLHFLDTNIVDEIEGYPALAAPINELITDIMAQYRARLTRLENSEEQA
ncbi:MAG: hypothetical protein ACQEQV_05850 [Fibrobacterota bacterium]